MYAPMQPQPARRRKKRFAHGLKTVEVSRGRNGYGFTISGQNPCILSSIASSSPADRAGLKTGDFLMSVNEQDVSHSSHDDVVRLVGSSSGLLLLQIAENFNSSDSSDDEFHQRPKSRYPNRTRTKPVHAKQSFDDVQTGYSCEGRSGRTRKSDHAKLRSISPGRDSEQHALDHHNHRKHSKSRGRENIDPVTGGVIPKRHKHTSIQGGVIRYHGQNTKHTIITREARLGLSKSNSQSEGIRLHPHRPTPAVQPNLLHKSSRQQSGQSSSGTSQGTQSQASTSSTTTSEDTLEEEQEMSYVSRDYMRTVVGYVGSVEMPSDRKMPNSRLQSIRGAIHRLSMGFKIHTMVIMEIATNGVRLINTMGSTVAHYPASKIAFSGVSPDDQRFFGIVTSQGNEMSNDSILLEDEDIACSSCHVFMVDPELSQHSIHIHKARNFGIQCTLNPKTQRCVEFPQSAVPVTRCMAHLYKERTSTIYETEMAQAFAPPKIVPNVVQGVHPRLLPSSSSTSDSGLGIVREDPHLMQPPRNDSVFVVEMNVSSRSQISVPSPHQSLLVNSSRDITSQDQASEIDISAILPSPSDQYSVSGNSMSDPSILSSDLSYNTSTSSQHGSHTMERLKVRAMPDPFGIVHPNDYVAEGAGHVRRSAQRLMTQQQPLGFNSSNADPNAITNADMKNTSIIKSRQSLNSHSRQISLPSSIGHQSSSFSQYVSTLQKKGSTAGNTGSHNMSKDYSGMTSIASTPSFVVPVVSQSKPIYSTSKAHPSRRRPPLPERQPIIPRRLPKTPLRAPSHLTSRPKSTPPYQLDELMAGSGGYDSDPGSIMADPEESILAGSSANNTKFDKSDRSGDGKRIDVPSLPPRRTSNSHESLVVSDADFGEGLTQLNSATSVTGITHRGTVVQHGSNGTSAAVGRVASWAVTFDRLLRDPAGIAVFTDFLKKEYSEENIMFWRSCEEYKYNYHKDNNGEKALDIFDKYLSSSAPDPVNVDSQARQCAQQGLPNPSPAIFEPAKQQIYRLMKQDSYSRFIKSQLYKDCVLVEMEGRPLPYSTLSNKSGSSNAMLQESNNNQDNGSIEFDPKRTGLGKLMMKSKSQASHLDEGGDEKRRRSFLPWNKAKSEKKLVKTDSDQLKVLTNGSVTPRGVETATEDGRPSLELADLSVMSRQVHTAEKAASPKRDKENRQKFCRVLLPDGSTTVIPVTPGVSTREALARLCERRHLQLFLLDAVSKGKLIELDQDISVLGSKEISLLKKVVFRLDLPARRVVAVCALAKHSIRMVFSPILERFGLKLDHTTVVHVYGTGVILNEEQEVGSLENKQVIVQSLDDFKEWGSFGSHRSLSGKPPLPRQREPLKNTKTTGDALSQLFKDVLDTSATGFNLESLQFDEQGVWDPQKGKTEEKRNSGIMGFIRRNSVGEKDTLKPKAKNKAVFSSQRSVTSKALNDGTADEKTVLHSTYQAASKKKIVARDEDQFLDLLTRVQRHQIDDQRGISLKGIELPDFLKGSTPDSENVDQPQQGSCNVQYSVSLDNSLCQLQKGLPHLVPESPAGGMIPHTDQSFSQEGILPSPRTAHRLFSGRANHSVCSQNSHFEDSHISEMSFADIGMTASSHRLGSDQSWDGGDDIQSVTQLRKRPDVPSRRNPPAHLNERKTLTPSSGNELDMTLTPPSPEGSVALPSPPMHQAPAEALDMPNFAPPTPIVRQTHPPRDMEIQPLESDPEPELLSIGSSVDMQSISPSSTPSPTTHDLIFDPDDAAVESQPPQAAQCTSIMKRQQSDGSSEHCHAAQRAKKTLTFDASEAKGDIQVSFV